MLISGETKFDYDFIGERDDDLKCLICFEVARNPWQYGECGRLYTVKNAWKSVGKIMCVPCAGQSSLNISRISSSKFLLEIQL